MSVTDLMLGVACGFALTFTTLRMLAWKRGKR
jgi:hypothetical protein